MNYDGCPESIKQTRNYGTIVRLYKSLVPPVPIPNNGNMNYIQGFSIVDTSVDTCRYMSRLVMTCTISNEAERWETITEPFHPASLPRLLH